MPSVDVDTITFASGSWEIMPDQINRLAVIADGINRAMREQLSGIRVIRAFTRETFERNRFAEANEAVAETAEDAGLEDYKVLVNVGEGGGQTVFHLHWHVLGGRFDRGKLSHALALETA